MADQTVRALPGRHGALSPPRWWRSGRRGLGWAYVSCAGCGHVTRIDGRVLPSGEIDPPQPCHGVGETNRSRGRGRRCEVVFERLVGWPDDRPGDAWDDDHVRELLEQAIPGAEELDRALAECFVLTPEQEQRRYSTPRLPQRYPKGGRK